MRVFLHNDIFLRRALVAGGMVAAAWLLLVLWSQSPYAMWLDHGEMDAIEASLPVRLAVFAVGWALMVIAMMLPSTLPMLAQSVRILPLLAGWLVVWMLFGAIAYLADGAVHGLVQRAPALAGMVAPLLLLSAGLYQLTSIKQGFLVRCNPAALEVEGLLQRGVREQWYMGVRHGIHCVGSCWALMLLMMALGGMNLAGMLGMGIVMSAERLTRHGRPLARAIGVLLIVAAVAVTLLTNAHPHAGGHTH